MAGGRPTKFTEEVRNRIINAIQNGLSKEQAAQCAGVSYDSFRRWETKGEQNETGEFREFCESLKKARAQLFADCLATLHRARRGGDKVEEVREVIREGRTVERVTTTRIQGPQWQAAAWILERGCPELWSRRSKNEVELNDKRTPEQKHEDMVIESMAGMADEDLLALFRPWTHPEEFNNG